MNTTAFEHPLRTEAEEQKLNFKEFCEKVRNDVAEMERLYKEKKQQL